MAHVKMWSSAAVSSSWVPLEDTCHRKALGEGESLGGGEALMCGPGAAGGRVMARGRRRERGLAFIDCLSCAEHWPIFFFLKTPSRHTDSRCHYLDFKAEAMEAWRGLVICPLLGCW